MLIFNLLRLKDTKQDKILIIEPTTSLVEQLFKDFKDYVTIIVKETYIEYIKVDVRKRNKQKSYNIYLINLIYNLPKKEFSDFNMIINDETHLFKSNRRLQN